MAGETVRYWSISEGNALGSQYTQSTGWTLQGTNPNQKAGPGIFAGASVLAQRITDYETNDGDTSYLHATASGAVLAIRTIPWPDNLARNPIIALVINVVAKMGTASQTGVLEIGWARDYRRSVVAGAETQLGPFDKRVVNTVLVNNTTTYATYQAVVEGSPFAGRMPVGNLRTIMQYLSEVDASNYEAVDWMVYLKSGAISGGQLRITQVTVDVTYGSYGGPGEIIDSATATEEITVGATGVSGANSYQPVTAVASDDCIPGIGKLLDESAVAMDVPSKNITFRNIKWSRGGPMDNPSGDRPVQR